MIIFEEKLRLEVLLLIMFQYWKIIFVKYNFYYDNVVHFKEIPFKNYFQCMRGTSISELLSYYYCIKMDDSMMIHDTTAITEFSK